MPGNKLKPKVGEIWEVNIPSLVDNALVLIVCDVPDYESGICIDLDFGEGFIGIISPDQALNELWQVAPIRRIEEAAK